MEKVMKKLIESQLPFGLIAKCDYPYGYYE